MTREALVWVFKILGTLVLSVILWAVFLGRGATVATLTAVDTAGNATANGPLYEQVMFGDNNRGFKAYLQEEWCANSYDNGYWLDRQISNNWAAANSGSGSTYIVSIQP